MSLPHTPAAGQRGQILLLNGTPRSGKSSIAKEIQRAFPGMWINLGVDVYMQAIPAPFQPGIGLRPGGERPDLEPLVFSMYRALFASIAAHSREGLHIVADLGLHEAYASPLPLWKTAADMLKDCPAYLIGVRCPVGTIMERRIQTWGKGYEKDGNVPAPVLRWQQAVHARGLYDLEVDTSLLSPEECARQIGKRMETPPQALALLGGDAPASSIPG